MRYGNDDDDNKKEPEPEPEPEQDDEKFDEAATKIWGSEGWKD